MTFYENAPKTKKHGRRELTCPHCLKDYTLGINGTVNGCDECEGITRNADGMIIPNVYAEVFIHEEINNATR